MSPCVTAAVHNCHLQGLSADQREAEKAKLLRRLDVNADGAMDFGEFANWFRRISTSIKKFESKVSAVEAHRAATGQDQGSTGGKCLILLKGHSLLLSAH